MGTLSKSLCSCGGFVAGSEALTDLLRYKAPGFVYSVGLSTPNTAAAQAALEEITEHPEYVVELREKCAEFQLIAKSLNLNTGDSEGFAVCPVIIGDSLRSVWVSNHLKALSCLNKEHYKYWPLELRCLIEALDQYISESLPDATA